MEFRLVETIPVINDRGEETTLSVYQKMIPIPRRPPIPGRKSVFAEDGKDVNRIDDDIFQVVVTGEILMRI